MLDGESLIIRIGQNSDLKEIKKIDESLKIVTDTIYRIQKDNDLQQSINNKNLIISTIKAKPVGYLWYEYLWGYIPFISFIRVHKSFHRKSIGEKMFKFLEKKLIEMQDERILSSIGKENTIALKFHQNLGFKECGYFELSHLIPNRELWLEKLLID